MWKIYVFEENDAINPRDYVLNNNRNVMRLFTRTSLFSQKIQENRSEKITRNGSDEQVINDTNLQRQR